MPDWLQLSAEVRQALDDNKPIVALESTVISHGLPYPQNLETSHMLEETIRKHGATPATIAILGGVPRVGLGQQELEYLQARVNQVKVYDTLKQHLPYVGATLFGDCIRSLRPDCRIRDRIKVGQQLQSKLRANARRSQLPDTCLKLSPLTWKK